ncbi:MAG: cysteine desulfurase [Leptospirales bacterium]|nr:cysteine desulfurase [Leptospirales bacterium]
MIDVQKIKTDFPYFSSDAGKKCLYADSAATTHKPRQVLDAINSIYTEHYAAINRTAHEGGEIFSAMYYEARRKTASFIGAPSPDEIIFTRNCTDAINHAANMLLRSNASLAIKPGSRIISTIMEHHSNIAPWQELARLTGSEIVYAELTNTGIIDIDHFKSLITPKTRLAAFSHVSNVLGSINPVAELCAVCREAGLLTLIDGTQAVPHMNVDVSKIGCDFYAFSGHKMLAPTGTGALWGRAKLLEKMPPSFYGGGMIEHVTTEDASWAAVPWKFEPGTPDACGAIALSAAIDYLTQIGMDAVHAHEQELALYTRKLLSKIDGIEILSPPDGCGIVAFIVKKNGQIEDSNIFGNILSSMGIVARTGGHCAYPLHKYLGLDKTGSIRLSYYIYNDTGDADKICAGVESSIKNLL